MDMTPEFADTPSELRMNLNEEIEYVKEFYWDLESNIFGDEGGTPPSTKLVSEGVIFLERMRDDFQIRNPEINWLGVTNVQPSFDASVDLSFRTKTARLLINIKDSEVKYYGKTFEDNGDTIEEFHGKHGHILELSLDLVYTILFSLEYGKDN